MIWDFELEQLSTTSEQFRLRNFTHKAWWNDGVVYKHFTTQPQVRQAGVIITNRLSNRTRVRCLVKYRTSRMKAWDDLKYISLDLILFRILLANLHCCLCRASALHPKHEPYILAYDIRERLLPLGWVFIYLFVPLSQACIPDEAGLIMSLEDHPKSALHLDSPSDNSAKSILAWSGVCNILYMVWTLTV